MAEAHEPADAVVHVDDVVADLEVAEVGEEGARRGAAAVGGTALLLEDIGFREHLQRRVCQPEPARQLAGGHEDRGRVRHLAARLDVVALARIDEHGRRDQFVIAEHLDGALGAAGRGGDEQDGLAGLARAPDLLHPVGDAPAELDGGLAAETG